LSSDGRKLVTKESGDGGRFHPNLRGKADLATDRKPVILEGENIGDLGGTAQTSARRLTLFSLKGGRQKAKVLDGHRQSCRASIFRGRYANSYHFSRWNSTGSDQHQQFRRKLKVPKRTAAKFSRMTSAPARRTITAAAFCSRPTVRELRWEGTPIFW
jgi:hypothetical protein